LLKRDYSVFIGDVDSDVARGELPYHLKDKTREKKNGLLKMGYVDRKHFIIYQKTAIQLYRQQDTLNSGRLIRRRPGR